MPIRTEKGRINFAEEMVRLSSGLGYRGTHAFEGVNLKAGCDSNFKDVDSCDEGSRWLMLMTDVYGRGRRKGRGTIGGRDSSEGMVS